MNKYLSAADKHERDRLQYAQRAVADDMRQHQQQCAQCRPGKDWHKRACKDGWELAKALQRADADLREWNRRGELAEHNGQLRLF